MQRCAPLNISFNQNLEKIKKDIDDLKLNIIAATNKKYRDPKIVKKMITKICCKLNAVKTHGSNALRAQRKDVLQQAFGLELLLKPNTSSNKSPVSIGSENNTDTTSPLSSSDDDTKTSSMSSWSLPSLLDDDSNTSLVSSCSLSSLSDDNSDTRLVSSCKLSSSLDGNSYKSQSSAKISFLKARAKRKKASQKAATYIHEVTNYAKKCGWKEPCFSMRKHKHQQKQQQQQLQGHIPFVSLQLQSQLKLQPQPQQQRPQEKKLTLLQYALLTSMDWERSNDNVSFNPMD